MPERMLRVVPAVISEMLPGGMLRVMPAVISGMMPGEMQGMVQQIFSLTWITISCMMEVVIASVTTQHCMKEGT